MLILFLLIIFVAGLLSPVQTSFNTRVSQGVGSAMVATGISSVVGALCLLVLTLCYQHSLALPEGITATLPWWAWLGGCIGIVGVACNIVLFPKLGSVQTVLFPMVGQLLAGLSLDSFGWFGATLRPITGLHVLGYLLVAVGVCVAVIRKTEQSDLNEISALKKLPYQLLGIFAGYLFGIQPTVNFCLATALGSSLQASFISFATGIPMVLLIVAGVYAVRACKKRSAQGAAVEVVERRPIPWWAWLGGVIGVIGVWAGASFVAEVGAALFNIMFIFGMQLCSMFIDHFALFGCVRRPITARQIVGMSLVFVGIILLNL